MKITVITVVLNRVNVIGNCISSVQSQNYKNYEHIIVDGLSSDGTIDVINKYLDSHIRFISEKDNGIFDALNKGINMASGDIIAVLNSDDYYYSSDIFEQVIKEFLSENYHMVFGNVQFVNQFRGKVLRKYNSLIFKKELIRYGFMPAHPAIFMLKSLVDSVGNYNSNYKIAGDFDYIVRTFKSGFIKYKALNIVVAEMVVGGISTSGFKSKILLNQETIKSLRENGYKTSWLNIMFKYLIKIKEFL